MKIYVDVRRGLEKREIECLLNALFGGHDTIENASLAALEDADMNNSSGITQFSSEWRRH